MSKKKSTTTTTATTAASSLSSASPTNLVQDDIQELTAERERLNETIEHLSSQLRDAEAQRASIDFKIQLALFDDQVKKDSACSQLIDAFDKARSSFATSLQTPSDYDEKESVPYRCSDDYADTSFFDDFVDQQLEVFRSRHRDSDFEGAVRVLLIMSELIQEMVEVVCKTEGADSGIILECREHVIEHWCVVTEEDPQFSSVMESNIGFVIQNRLDDLGKPFTAVFDWSS